MKAARLDLRLSEEQKYQIEYAAELEGYKNVTEFILSILNKRTNRIIKRHEAILTTQRDREIFFDALLSPSAPNQKLLGGARDYLEFINKNGDTDTIKSNAQKK